MDKAFGYTRLSGKGQEAGDGVGRQKLAIEKFAAENEIEIVRWFHDTQTGKDEWTERQGWSEMVSSMNGVRTIIVEKLDRVARVVLVQELILRDLKKREIRMLTSVGDDSEDEQLERVMLRQMLSVFAQYERGMIVVKLRHARDKVRAIEGRCEGAKPYGHFEGEMVNLKEMRRLRKAGWPFHEISGKFNKEGVLTRYGKAWFPSTVCRILAREKAGA